MAGDKPATRCGELRWRLGSGGVGDGWWLGEQVADVATGALLPAQGGFEVPSEEVGDHPSLDAVDAADVESFVGEADLELVVPVLGVVAGAVVVGADLDATEIGLLSELYWGTSRPSREAANRLYQRIGFEPRETNVYRYSL